MFVSLSTSRLRESFRVCLDSPCHDFILVLVVLLEASELLPDQDAAPIVEMVSWHVLQVLAPIPHVPSINFYLKSFLPIHCTHHHKNETEPEWAIFCEEHFTVVVHRMGRTRSLKIVLVWSHIVLEFNCILWSDNRWILMVIVQVVVHVRLMEFANGTKGGSSDWSTALLRQTTLVVAEMVNVVLCALLFKLCHTF